MAMGEVEERPNTSKACPLTRDETFSKCNSVATLYPRRFPIAHTKKPYAIRHILHHLVCCLNKNKPIVDAAASIHHDYLRQAGGDRGNQCLRLGTRRNALLCNGKSFAIQRFI